MKIDLSCPVELWKFSTPTPEEPECTFVLNNLSEKVVVSVQVTMICNDREDRLVFRQVERIQGLSAGAGESFSIMLLPNQWQDVAGVELVIEKVWFDDAMIWRRDKASLTEYQPNSLPPGRALDELRFVAGKDAVGYPQIQEHVWMCVCGRPNPKQSRRCCRCGRGLETVMASYQKTNVDQLIAIHEQKLLDIAKKAREDASKLAQEREKAIKLKERQAKRRLRRIVALVCVMAAAAALFLWGLPALRLGQAEALLTQGRYEQARAAFASLGNSAWVQEKLLHCDYLEAKSWMDAGDLSSLQKAAVVFAGQGEYEDSHALWQQCFYRMGEMELEAGAFESAAENFQELGDYQDSTDKLREATYRQAVQLMANDGVTAAQVLFRSLGQYRDSQAKVLECEYLLGVAAEESNQLEAALRHYELLGDYQDVSQRMQATCYALAEQKLAQGAFEDAGKLYLRAGEYQDAKLKANNSLYQLAREVMEAGDYAKASELFGEIVPYLDSESQQFECVYRQGEALFAAQDFSGAGEMFRSIPQHRDALDRAKECDYLIAQEYLAQGELEKAESLLQGLGDYQDSQKLLSQRYYDQALQAMAEGRFAEAAAQFQDLGDFEDSAQKAKECRYQQGMSAFAEGNYAAAIEAFRTLGKYQDAPQKLEDSTYQLAMQQKESGDMEKAIALFSSLPKHSEAQQQLSEISYTQAVKKKEEGDLAGASDLFLALGEFQDARDQYQACQYELALQLRNQGKHAQAGAIFLALGGYKDAAQLSQASFQEAFGSVADPAREAFQRKEYRVAYETLKDFPMEELPEQYADLPQLRDEACYLYAEELYDQNKPYEALPYYQAIRDYKDVADRKLTRRAYLILGTWESSTGKTAVFRSDGTCNLMGSELYFDVDNYSLLTGESPQTLTLTHKLTSINKEGMTLREAANNGVVFKFTHVSDEQPAATPKDPTYVNPLDEMLVQEEDNALPGQ